MPELPHPQRAHRRRLDLEAADAIEEGDRIRAQIMAEAARRAQARTRRLRQDPMDLSPGDPPESAAERYARRNDE